MPFGSSTYDIVDVSSIKVDLMREGRIIRAVSEKLITYFL
jgi:hypothetical protein